MAARVVVLWDPFVRVFHWSVAVAFLLDRFVTEGGELLHERLGYGACGLVLARIAWGFGRTGAARWAHFWPTPARLASHLKDLREYRPHRVLGHSPLGALVMITMMVGLVGLALSGYAMEEIDYFWGDEGMHTFHLRLADVVTVLAFVHVAAAVVQSILLRENLVLSMITGRRRVEDAVERVE